MKNLIKNSFLSVVAVATLSMFNSCEDLEQFEPIGANSIADETPPNALFTVSQGQGGVDAWKDYSFANASTSATTYAWDFGNGEVSSEVDGTTTYLGEGTYTVSLTASDNLGVVSTYSETFDVVEPEIVLAILPVILEPSFEVNSLPDGSGDGRDSWRNSNLGGVIQINTSSSVPDGGKAAKFPGAGDRIGYQEIEVSPNTDYVISYSYRLEAAGGSCTVAILAGEGFTTQAETDAAIIQSFTGSAETYTPVNILFNSGANSTVSIYITNQGEEARVDNFTASLQ